MLRRINLKPGESPEGLAADGPRLLVLNAPPAEAQVARAGLSVRLLLAGEETFELDGRRWRLRAGELMAAWPGPPMTRRSQGSTRAIVLEVPMTAAEAVAAPAAIVMPVASHSLGRWLAARIAPLFEGGPQADAVAETVFEGARGELANMAATANARLGRVAAGKLATRLELLRRVEWARLRLEATETPLSLTGLSREVGVSAHHLARTFRDVFGASPIAYQRGSRLDRAADALRDGEKLADVAARAGYAEAATFARAFQRRHGISPGQAAKTKTPGGEAGRLDRV